MAHASDSAERAPVDKSAVEAGLTFARVMEGDECQTKGECGGAGPYNPNPPENGRREDRTAMAKDTEHEGGGRYPDERKGAPGPYNPNGDKGDKSAQRKGPKPDFLSLISLA